MSTTLEDYRARLQLAVERLSTLRGELERERRASREPVAIVGMGCRLPPTIASPDALFEALANGHDAIRDAPETRFAEPSGLPRAGYLDAVAGFDAGFFAIAPREAAAIDPQQRLLLEVVWEALEHGGQVASKLAPDRVGVFVGLGASDYAELSLTGEPEARDIYTLTGVGHAFASGRLAYCLGFRGPCLTLDTACSSSLVALHLAVASLRRRETDVAIAAGAQLLLTPTTSALLERSGALAADGRCKVFDHGADGFTRGEGAAALVLKRLSDAQRDGDPIAAVIRGSACNQDGRSAGLTAPNVIAQRQLLRRALADAGLPAHALGMIETHGTGTALGDPIELDALAEVFSKSNAAPILLGALKSNLGHLEAAAGLASVIKVATCLARGQITPNLHFERLNPHTSPQVGARFEIPTTLRPWPRPPDGGPRRAGVSSFGMSGTNAHVILEQAPPLHPRAAASVGRRYLLPVSARNLATLRTLAERTATQLEGECDPGDVCLSAATRREHFEHRAVVRGDSPAELAEGLRALSHARPCARISRGAGPTRRPVLVCAGQGSVWPGMGRALVDDPVAGEVLRTCDRLAREHGDIALLDELLAPPERSRLRRTSIAQPALLALCLSLAARLEAWGMAAAGVIGHSVGELAAAQLAGAVSLEQAMRLACARGRVMEAAHGQGAMATVALERSAAAEIVARSQGRLALAVINGPAATVLAGDPDALTQALTALDDAGVRHRRLDLDYAFHSPHMRALAPELRRALGPVEATQASLPLYSTVTGTRLRGPELAVEHWVRGVTDPVRFVDAVDAALDAGHRLFLELGPHPTLSGHLDAIASTRGLEVEVDIVASLRRDQPALEQLHRCVAELHAHGCALDLGALADARDRAVALPSYPWQRRDHWLAGADPRWGPPAPTPTPREAAIAEPGLELGEPWRARRGRRFSLIHTVHAQVAAVLGLAPDQSLSTRAGLIELGLDSMMAVELKNHLQAHFELGLDATLVFDHPTIEAIAAHLERRLERGEARTQLSTMPGPSRAHEHEPIAIVGMACRFPGGANDLDSYWTRLLEGVDATCEPPAQRWDHARYHDPDPEARGKTYGRRGGFLTGVDLAEFDAAFFKLSPAEAAALDPQQRLLLELSWEALEHGGQSPDRLVGSATGVFVGIATADYAQMVTQVPLAELDTYVSTGNAANTAAGRIAYQLGLHGPVMALDTACSSSLVATHLACQSLRRGEAELALAGGVNLILVPTIDVMYARLGALAPDSRCKAFDAQADGMVRGEGGAMVVLKRLCDAQRDGDRVLALIRGSAINHDGRAAGLTVPNGAAQRAVIRAALADAELEPASVHYVETHGTGTRLGDPIEANALVAELGRARDPEQTLWLGAAKASFGHLEAAAGMVGLVKAALVLDRRRLPPQRNFTRLNPAIETAEVALRIPEMVETLPEGPLFAGLSSFGMSGTNAHLVLESPRRGDAKAETETTTAATVVLPISARSEDALRELAARYRERLRGCDDIARVCRAAAQRRAHLEHRLAVTGSQPAQLLEALDAYLEDRAHGSWVAGAGARPRVAFVFAGHSAHWLGMGRELLESEPVFRAVLEACAAAAERAGMAGLLDELCADDDTRWSQLAVIQPLVLAMQIALASQWRHWGIVPEAVVGHSMGEIAAACVAGALSLDEAFQIVVARSQLLARVEGQGKMAVVGLDLERTRARLGPAPVSIAAANSPRLTVVSGSGAAIEALVAELRADNVFARIMAGTRGAGHSPQLDPLLPELAAALAGLRPRQPELALYSTVLGARDDALVLDADYWVRNLRQPVYFTQTIERMGADGFDVFVEISPDARLLGAIEQTLRPRGGTLTRVASLERGRPERATLCSGLARLHVEGADVEWSALYPGRCLAETLPTQPWQRQRHWLDAAHYVEPGTLAARPHPLLGPRLDSATEPGRTLWQLELRRDRSPIPIIEQQGTGLLATAYLLELIDAAVRLAWPEGERALADIELEGAIAFAPDPEARIELQLVLDELEGQAQLFARAAGGRFSRRLAARLVTISPRAASGEEAQDFDLIAARCQRRDEDTWARLEARDLDFPRELSVVGELRRSASAEGELLARLDDPRSSMLHWPCAALELGLWLLAELGEDPGALPVPGQLARPIGIGQAELGAGALEELGPPAWVHARRSPTEPDGPPQGAVTIYDLAGRRLAAFTQVTLAAPDAELTALAVNRLLPEWLYQLNWRSRANDGPAAPAGACLVISDDAELARACVDHLARAGWPALRVDGHTLTSRDACHEALRRTRELGPLRAVVFAQVAAVGSLGLEGWVADRSRLLLDLGHALIHERAGLRLQLVTRASQAVTHAQSCPGLAAAPLWGLARAIGLEQPTIQVRGLDLPPAATPDDPGHILAELCTETCEDSVAYREGERFVQRLRRAEPPTEAGPLRLRADATYLITGGLGGVGRQLAARLFDAGARRLVLLGRRGLPELPPPASDPRAPSWRAVEALRARGAEIVVAAVDVGDRPALAELLAAIPDERALRGVFHCAGISEPRPLIETEAADIEATYRAKVSGAWALHELSASLELDCFVLFSSMASVWGAAGLGPYDGANHFLDVLAHHRRALGLPALAVNWGGWAGSGMTDADVQRYAARMGLGVAPAPQLLTALERLLVGEQLQVAVGPIDWRVFKPVLESYGPRPLLEDIELGREDAGRVGEGPLRTAIIEAEAGSRWGLLVAELRTLVAALLGFDNAEAIAEDTGLFELGMDSVSSVALRNDLERALGLSLAPTLAFEHPNVLALATFLAQQLELDMPRATGEPRPDDSEAGGRTGPDLDPDPDPELAALDEDALEALLAAELDKGPT